MDSRVHRSSSSWTHECIDPPAFGLMNASILQPLDSCMNASILHPSGLMNASNRRCIAASKNRSIDPYPYSCRSHTAFSSGVYLPRIAYYIWHVYQYLHVVGSILDSYCTVADCNILLSQECLPWRHVCARLSKRQSGHGQGAVWPAGAAGTTPLRIYSFLRRNGTIFSTESWRIVSLRVKLRELPRKLYRIDNELPRIYHVSHTRFRAYEITRITTEAIKL